MEEDRVMVVYWLLRDGEDERRICCFYTSVFSEWIRALYFCKEYGIDFYPNSSDKNIDNEAREMIDGIGAHIKDFNVMFGSDESIQSIEVYLE